MPWDAIWELTQEQAEHVLGGMDDVRAEQARVEEDAARRLAQGMSSGG